MRSSLPIAIALLSALALPHCARFTDGIANEDETALNVTGYVRVFNNSGELYDNAQTRLVVGTINLVEKIADLATRPAPEAFRQFEDRWNANAANGTPTASNHRL